MAPALRLTAGKSLLLQLSENAARLSVGNPDVADVVLIVGADDSEAERARGRVGRVREIGTRELISPKGPAASPFASSERESTRELVMSLMYEDGGEFKAFLAEMRERAKVVAL